VKTKNKKKEKTQKERQKEKLQANEKTYKGLRADVNKCLAVASYEMQRLKQQFYLCVCRSRVGCII